MAMNLITAKTEIVAVVKTAAQAKWGRTEADYQDFAEVVADAVARGLQHVLDNAKTSVDAEDIL